MANATDPTSGPTVPTGPFNVKPTEEVSGPADQVIPPVQPYTPQPG